MPNVTWVGDEDPSAQRITHGGYTFVKGEAVVVDKDHMVQFEKNPVFSAEKNVEPVKAIEPEIDPDEGSEKGELKRMLREAGQEVKGNPSVETLRDRLSKLTAPHS
jgi:hypothetical protein